MKFSTKLGTLTTLLTAVAVTAFANPGVKHVSTTTTKFHGFLGSMMKMAGGGNIPQSQTMYLQGDLQRTDHSNDKGELLTSNLVDLSREVFINIDHKKKEYSETTFAEWKAMLEKMKGQGSGKAEKPSKADKSDVKVDFDVKVDRTNERQTIAGFNAQKAILTMKARGEQQATANKASGSGSMTIVSNHWLTKDVAAYEEMTAFSRKFAEKLGMQFSEAGGQNFMQSMSRMNPEMVKGMEKLAEEGKKLEGFAVKTETSFEMDGSSSGGQQMPGSVSGLLGGLGKKSNKPAQEGAASEKNVLFESTTETLELKSGSLAPELFKVNAEYKNVEAKK